MPGPSFGDLTPDTILAADQGVSPFAVFGLKPGADPEQVRRAFEGIIRAFDPAVYPDASPTERQNYRLVQSVARDAFGACTDPSKLLRWLIQRSHLNTSGEGSLEPDENTPIDASFPEPEAFRRDPTSDAAGGSRATSGDQDKEPRDGWPDEIVRNAEPALKKLLEDYGKAVINHRGHKTRVDDNPLQNLGNTGSNLFNWHRALEKKYQEYLRTNFPRPEIRPEPNDPRYLFVDDARPRDEDLDQLKEISDRIETELVVKFTRELETRLGKSLAKPLDRSHFSFQQNREFRLARRAAFDGALKQLIKKNMDSTPHGAGLNLSDEQREEVRERYWRKAFALYPRWEEQGILDGMVGAARKAVDQSSPLLKAAERAISKLMNPTDPNASGPSAMNEAKNALTLAKQAVAANGAQINFTEVLLEHAMNKVSLKLFVLPPDLEEAFETWNNLSPPERIAFADRLRIALHKTLGEPPYRNHPASEATEDLGAQTILLMKKFFENFGPEMAAMFEKGDRTWAFCPVPVTGLFAAPDQSGFHLTDLGMNVNQHPVTREIWSFGEVFAKVGFGILQIFNGAPIPTGPVRQKSRTSPTHHSSIEYLMGLDPVAHEMKKIMEEDFGLKGRIQMSYADRDRTPHLALNLRWHV